MYYCFLSQDNWIHFKCLQLKHGATFVQTSDAFGLTNFPFDKSRMSLGL